VVIGHPHVGKLGAAKHLSYTTVLDDLLACNCYIVTVPTPIDEHKRPDLTPLIKASETVGKVLKPGDIVIYESTVYPGCTEEDCVPVLEKHSSLKFNQDFFCGYSPERINPGDKERTILAELERVIVDLARETRSPVRIVGHNIAGFDAPFLALRGAKHGVNLGRFLRSPSGTPWDAPLVDTSLAWPCSSRPARGQLAGSGKLTDVATFLGIAQPSNPIDGSQVLSAYLDGRLHDIVEHCRHDIAVLRSVHQRMIAAGLVTP
jgi:hypothetical protein